MSIDSEVNAHLTQTKPDHGDRGMIALTKCHYPHGETRVLVNPADVSSIHHFNPRIEICGPPMGSVALHMKNGERIIVSEPMHKLEELLTENPTG